MQVNEWALIIFSILAQMSVGTFVLLGLANWYAQSKGGGEAAEMVSTKALLAIGPTLVLGLVASLLHLGNPLNAWRSVMNVETSWLSREILFGVLFAGLGAVFAFMQWRKIGSQAARNVVAVLAALVGLALVFSMSQVYMVPTQPAWNTPATPINFFTTTFLLGSLALGTALLVSYEMSKKDLGKDDKMPALLRDIVRWIAVAALVLLGIELVTLPVYLGSLAGSGTEEGIRSLGQLFNQFGVLLVVRLAAVFLGAGVFGMFVYRAAVSSEKGLGFSTLLYSAFALVLVSEVIGRFLFYAVHYRIGL